MEFTYNLGELPIAIPVRADKPQPQSKNFDELKKQIEEKKTPVQHVTTKETQERNESVIVDESGTLINDYYDELAQH